VATISAVARHSPRHVHVAGERGNSTLGDLIVALTDETSRFVHDEKKVYRLVAYMVTDLLFRFRLFSRRWH
jgi:hypothetical protein